MREDNMNNGTIKLKSKLWKVEKQKIDALEWKK